MARFKLDCVERTSGEDRTIHLEGESETDVVKKAGELGYSVVKTTRSAAEQPAPPDSLKPPTRNPAVPRPSATPVTASERMEMQGLVLAVLGIAVVIWGLFMDTSVRTGELGLSRVENIGLLNAKLCTIIIGCSAIITGVLLRGLGHLGRQIAESREGR